MANTFLNRVSAERRVLSVINERLPRADQLAGLSRSAILVWCAKVGHGRVSSVYNRLISIAEQCQRLSCRSNETFLPLERIEAENIEEQLIELRKEMEKCL